MTAIVTWYEMIVGSIPLPLLEVLGRFSYIVGLFLAFCAFGGFTFRIGEHWGFGRARQTWNVHAFLSVPLTFVLIIASGYIGSFIVLVPGAQTFESLKDLVVLLSVVLLGYPALITIPFAYGVSDLIEGVPPEFLLAWLPGYFINPSYFWIAYQFIGKNPDFRMGRTWWRYLIAAVLFMALEPVLWGYVCSDQFPSGISYHSHHAGAVLHDVDHLGHGASGLSGRPAAGQTVRMVLGRDPRTRQRTRDWEQRVDLGIRPRRDAGQRRRGAGGPANPALHLLAFHRSGAGDGWSHGGCRAAER